MQCNSQTMQTATVLADGISAYVTEHSGTRKLGDNLVHIDFILCSRELANHLPHYDETKAPHLGTRVAIQISGLHPGRHGRCLAAACILNTYKNSVCRVVLHGFNMGDTEQYGTEFQTLIQTLEGCRYLNTLTYDNCTVVHSSPGEHSSPEPPRTICPGNVQTLNWEECKGNIEMMIKTIRMLPDTITQLKISIQMDAKNMDRLMDAILSHNQLQTIDMSRVYPSGFAVYNDHKATREWSLACITAVCDNFNCEGYIRKLRMPTRCFQDLTLDRNLQKIHIPAHIADLLLSMMMRVASKEDMDDFIFIFPEWVFPDSEEQMTRFRNKRRNDSDTCDACMRLI